ncbi:hypothetical protein C1646_661731 [Rhizophagus diaphanus]|nr:hypothetical protein C1646_661731 [Rhizophagus diaphanus] [Rhizophagus sp. MUCL 43196]
MWFVVLYKHLGHDHKTLRNLFFIVRSSRHFETDKTPWKMPVNRKSFMQRARKTGRDMVRAREHRNRINGISTVGNISNSQFVELIASNNTEFEPHIRRDSATDQSEVDASTVAAGQEIQSGRILYRVMMAFKCGMQEGIKIISRSADVSGLVNQIMLGGGGGSYVTRLSTI